MTLDELTEPERRFASRAVRRQRLFAALSGVGVAVGVGLFVYYAWRKFHNPSFPVGARSAIVVLVLLNARQNLRQYRYAKLLAKLAS